MAIQSINIGNLVNDGLGDDLRTAFQKVNANFAELSTQLSVTATNVGAGAGLFKEKIGGNLVFKSINSGSKISINETSESIIINSTVPDAFISITTDTSVVEANSDPAVQTDNLTLTGGPGIRVSNIGRVIRIDALPEDGSIFTDYDFGPLDGNYDNAIQLSLAAANIDFGTILIPGRLSLNFGSLPVVT
jgi:hypothetical protein